MPTTFSSLLLNLTSTAGNRPILLLDSSPNRKGDESYDVISLFQLDCEKAIQKFCSFKSNTNAFLEPTSTEKCG